MQKIFTYNMLSRLPRLACEEDGTAARLGGVVFFNDTGCAFIFVYLHAPRGNIAVRGWPVKRNKGHIDNNQYYDWIVVLVNLLVRWNRWLKVHWSDTCLINGLITGARHSASIRDSILIIWAKYQESVFWNNDIVHTLRYWTSQKCIASILYLHCMSLEPPPVCLPIIQSM